MKNSKRGFIPIVLLIIIVAAAIGGGSYYYPQKFPITDPPTTTSTATTNISVCATTSDRILCFTDLAISKNDVNICSLALAPDDKEYCLGRFGGEKGSVAICDSISSNSNTQTKELCYIGVAKTNKDISICSKIDSQSSNRISCYIRVAEAKKDPTICKTYNVNGYKDGLSEFNCLLNVAKAANDSSICSNIKNENNGATVSNQQICINWVTKNIDPYTVQ